jgi:two-component system response regulator MprA
MSEMRILVVDDDAAVRESLRRALRLEGYNVELASDGAEALELIQRNGDEPDLVVLDVLMPNVDGLEVCRQLRRSGRRVPVLMLTARDEVVDRVAGLDAGADDYVVKPFSLDELFARLRALLRRNGTPEQTDELVVADLRLDPLRRTVRRGSRDIELTKTEFDLLELLMEHAGIVLSRDQIYEHIWGFDFETGSRSLDVYVGYLRRKTEADGEPRLVHTVRGVGYVVRP